MAASLCIQVSSLAKQEVEEFHFMEEEWTAGTEQTLLARIQEMLSVVRHIGTSVEVTINFEVTDMQAAVFLLKKKGNAQVEINHCKLSIREIEVLGLIMRGLTNQEIADKLFIGYETVRSHRKNILDKTGAKNTAALITYYHQTFFEK